MPDMGQRDVAAFDVIHEALLEVFKRISQAVWF